MRDIVVLRWMRHCRAAAVAGELPNAKGLFANVSQKASRQPANIGTFCTSSVNYSYEQDRLVLPIDALRCLGWPKVDTRGISHQNLKNLVGEGMLLPQVVCILLATLYEGSFEGLFENPLDGCLATSSDNGSTRCTPSSRQLLKRRRGPSGPRSKQAKTHAYMVMGTGSSDSD